MFKKLDVMTRQHTEMQDITRLIQKAVTIYIYYHSFRRNNVDGRISSYLHSDRLDKDMCKQQALHAVGDKHGFGNETCRIIKFNLVWNGGGVMRFDF